MSNFRYHVDNQDIILSQDEHEKILATKGGQIVFLREGKLAINPAYIKFVKETDQLTEEQEIKKLENPKFLDGRSRGSARQKIKESHFEFYEKMGWDHQREDCACKTWVLN